MTSLIVRLVITDPVSTKETVFPTSKSDIYSPDILEIKVLECFEFGVTKFNNNVELFRKHTPEISILLNIDESENVRPSFHLSKEIILKLASVGASIDFDPYL
jgi:predicted DNA-binding protein (MmcQ/YjbR family)